MEGALTLGQVAEWTATLEVAGRRCRRHGRYNVVRLVERHGAEFLNPLSTNYPPFKNPFKYPPTCWCR